ncbi:MAG TPA: sulfite exporter TauE/SafE family protein [Casimicrobiaceae bacterium]|nr:sulfite exporter TauE/SafE family protein [Casimicrobiaceae bacterium]
MSETAVLVAGTLAGSLVFGVSGFAFALTASVIWLQALSPAQVLPLAVICPLLLNIVTFPAIRRDIRVARLWPFVAGSTLGVPLGVVLVLHVDATWLRNVIAVLLIAYSGVALTRPRLPEVRLAPALGRVADGGVGFVGGVLGGIAGLSAVLPSLWIGVRGWPKAEQRGLLQSFGFYSQALTLAVFLAYAGFGRGTLAALAICLPIAIVGSLLGLALFRRMSGDTFRRAVLWIVLAGGLGLLARTLR